MAGCGNLMNKGAQAPNRALFLCPKSAIHGGWTGQASAWPVPLFRFSTPVPAAAQSPWKARVATPIKQRSQTMTTTQATPNNPLMNGISDATKARVIESLFPNQKSCYADEITHNLTRVKRVLTGLSKLGAQDEGEDQITGELAMALSELLEQQVDIAIVILQGSVFDQTKPNNI